MPIIEKSYKWNGGLTKRTGTDYIVLHHAATTKSSADDIHRIHRSNGWTGIGYHFYVRKDGSIYRGRPIDTVGAHASGYNSRSVGICFEGNFETEKMSDTQLKSGREIISYVKKYYTKARVVRHKDLNATACPGKSFPFDNLLNTDSKVSEVKKIVYELALRGIMTDRDLWLQKCASDENAYWLAFKICNLTANAKMSKADFKSESDIVQELNCRGIILEKDLWLKLFKEDKNLYWLGFKAANMTENGVCKCI